MTEPSWHDALDLAVPELAAPPDMMQRLEHAVRVTRRRRRGAAAGSAVLVAGVVVSALLAPGLWPHGNNAKPSTGVGPTAAGLTPTPSAAHHAVAVTAPCRATDDPMGSPLTTDPLPADFTPAQAFLCVNGGRNYPGDGSWSVLLGQKLSGDLQPLTTALRHPNALTSLAPSAVPGGASGDHACDASLTLTPTIVLYDASGRAVRPGFPRDDCAKPQPAVSTALAGLHRTTVQVLKLRQVLTQAQTLSAKAAAKVGCQSQWKDEFRLGALAAKLNAGAPINWQNGAVTACLFADSDKDATVGDFLGGRRLSVTDRSRYLQAIELPGHGGGCAQGHHEFVVFTTGHGYASVEVGGCWRVLRQDAGTGSLGSADPSTVQQLVDSLKG
ncbi:MAG: hypothetical protein QOJ83_1859 [Frankiales bacterium]|nr:hypothetical protein [Frankiales bacterium]